MWLLARQNSPRETDDMTATDTTTMSTAQIDAERLRRKREVALGYRIFASLRWGDLGDGHITARDPEHTDCMWLLRYPVGFERATIDDLVLVRADGTTLDGRQINNTAHHIHHPIHAANPNVIGVAHTHTPWGTPFCASGRGLEPITQEACQFYERWAFFDDEEVQVLGLAGGERIAQAMGTNQAMLLRSHGLLTTGTSVAETIAAFVTLERVAEAHMKAPNAEPISEESARIARDDLLVKGSQEQAFQFLVQRHVGDPSVVG
ncbi:MAG: ribulose-5-phosphate 4-epimerase/fuculose-1-phosphate aldolase [Paracrocinitomix sp.]